MSDHLKLVNLEPSPPDPSVIELLEEALEAARQGKLRAVGLVAALPSSGVATVYTVGSGIKTPWACLITATSVLHRRLLEDYEG